MKKQIFLLILLSLFTSCVASQKCPRLCQCASNVWRCSGQDITDEMLMNEIAQAGDPYVEWLYLSSNKLTTFPAKAFVNFTKLLVLELNNNFISKLPRNLSTYIPTLATVSLNSNGLKVLKSEDFLGYHNIIRLHLAQNNISALEPGVFRHAPELRDLDFGNNKIKALRKGLFKGLTGLSRIWFRGNVLEMVEAGLFNDTMEMYEIYLDNNILKSLPTGFLTQHHTYLDLNIDLSSNQLTDEGLPDGIFDIPSDIMDVDLVDNKLTTIRKAWFGKVSIDSLSVSNNPIKCDCYSYKGFQHMLNSSSYFNIFGECASPSSLSGKSIKDVFSKNQVNCTSCSINKCMHNSTCTILDKFEYACNCTDSYYGQFCQKVNMCMTSPCLNNGTCANINGADYTCTCHGSYEGKNCQTIKGGKEKEESGLSAGYIALIVLIVLAVIIGLIAVLYLSRRRKGQGNAKSEALLNKL